MVECPTQYRCSIKSKSELNSTHCHCHFCEFYDLQFLSLDKKGRQRKCVTVWGHWELGQGAAFGLRTTEYVTFTFIWASVAFHYLRRVIRWQWVRTGKSYVRGLRVHLPPWPPFIMGNHAFQGSYICKDSLLDMLPKLSSPKEKQRTGGRHLSHVWIPWKQTVPVTEIQTQEVD